MCNNQEVYPESLDSYLDVLESSDEIEQFVTNYAIEYELSLTVDEIQLEDRIVADGVKTCRQAIEKYVDLSTYR